MQAIKSSLLAPALAALLALLASGCAGPESFEEAGSGARSLVLHGGVIETMDPELGVVEALALREGRVLAAGPLEEVSAAARALDDDHVVFRSLRGGFAMPGFIDSHGHFAALGQSRRVVDLRGCRSERELVDRVAAAAAGQPAGRWISGRGWDQNLWTERRFPTHDALSRAVPDHPCVLSRVDGHALLANAAAMAAAGVDEDSRAPRGGEIVRDAAGRPTGVFVDAAESLIRAAVPPPSEEELAADLLAAQETCLELGITSFHDAGIPRTQVAVLKRLYAEGRLAIRLYAMLGGSGATAEDFPEGLERLVDHAEGRLTLRSWKVGIDGALGSRGAALLEDYADRPGHRGLLLMDEEELVELSRRALDEGWQVCVHAIGDRGNRMALDAWERLFRERPEGRRARFRIEHAQILDAADIPRFARLGVVASMQTNHATTDLAWAEARLGRARVEEGAYAWRELIASGARFCNGTDAPVEDVSPVLNLRAAVTRDWGEGAPREGYHARQRLSRMEALASYTTGGAWAAFEEDRKGRLLPGMVADIVVLDRDLRTCGDDELGEAEVLETWLGGERVFEAETVSTGSSPR